MFVFIRINHVLFIKRRSYDVLFSLSFRCINGIPQYQCLRHITLIHFTLFGHRMILFVLTQCIAKFRETMHNRLFIYKQAGDESYDLIGFVILENFKNEKKRSLKIPDLPQFIPQSVLFRSLSIFIFHYQLLRKITKNYLT